MEIKKQAIASAIEVLLTDSERYISDLGEISMLRPCMATMNSYEILCIKGNLFQDIEIYATIDQVEDRIIELLTPKQITS